MTHRLKALARKHCKARWVHRAWMIPAGVFSALCIPPPFTYDGRTYSAYEASQYQRQMETAMRKTKRRIIAADGAGLSDEFTAESIKLRRQREMYRDFSHKAGLPTQGDRIQVIGFGRSVSSKSVWGASYANAQFASDKILQAHIDKHLHEYGNITVDEYLDNARSLLRLSASDDILHLWRSDGSLAVYRRSTNDFVVGTADGKIRTAFKPVDGYAYWEDELKRNGHQ